MKHDYKNRLAQLALWMAMAAMPLMAAAGNCRGDVNGDGHVTIADVSILIDGLLGNGTMDDDAADVNRDGIVSISDVSTLIDYLLGAFEFPPEEEEFNVNGVDFVMVPVEGGTFMMGATAEQPSDASDREKPVHQVTVSSFSIGQTEVTQALWYAVMGSNPSNFIGSQQPVERVSWDDCQLFIATLNTLTGKNFRLPTEAEWEFAARGGNNSQGYRYAGGNDLSVVGWYSYNDSWVLTGTGAHGTHEVATRMPNELNIFDMSGNVHEWCNDWYAGYSNEAVTNPTGPDSGSNRVYRGGSWYFDEWFSRVSFRNSVIPSYRSHGIGIRLAL